MGPITRFASSSFQLAMVYALVVLVTMVGSYFISESAMMHINEHLAGPDDGPLPNSYIYTQIAPFILLVMIVIAGLSFFISEFVVRRINTINRIADDIIRTRDLSRRIPIENEWDDLSKMALTLNAMLDQIEQLLQDIKTVSDNIAHDMRTPLTRLHQDVEKLGETEVQADKKKVAKLAQRISAEIETMLATFNALLRISNIEKGKRRAEYSTLRLCDMLEDVLALYEPLAEEKQIELVAMLPKNLPEMRVDKHLLFQAFANFTDNAIKYTPPGGRVVLSAQHEQGCYHVRIQDSGIGIPTKARDKVFQRFYRADQSRECVSGNGLGLSMAKAIIDLHQGKIELGDAAPGLIVDLHLPISTT